MVQRQFLIIIMIFYIFLEVVPYCDENLLIEDKLPSFYHVGVYAYRALALKMFLGSSWARGLGKQDFVGARSKYQGRCQGRKF